LKTIYYAAILGGEGGDGTSIIRKFFISCHAGTIPNLSNQYASVLARHAPTNAPTNAPRTHDKLGGAAKSVCLTISFLFLRKLPYNLTSTIKPPKEHPMPKCQPTPAANSRTRMTWIKRISLVPGEAVA
jgi:hypothetical protein